MTDAITATYVCTSGDFSSVSESSAEAHLLANPTHGLSIVHAGDDSVTSHAAFVEGAADAELQANKAQPNGYASLDGGGKVPVAQLPNAILTYKGTWNALTNTPTLADGTGTAGDVYRVSVEGTQDLGSGSRTWHVGDYAIYNTADIWEDADTTDAVSSVNTYTGAVVLAKADVGLGNVTNDAQLKASDLDADGTLAANSATKVPSQSAVKTYADTKATDSLTVHKAGAETITGEKTFTGDAIFKLAPTSLFNTVFEIRQQGQGQDALLMTGAGIYMGPGTVAPDTDLYRYGVDRLGTHSGVTIVQTSSIGSDATAGLVFRNAADNFTVGRIYARGDSEMGTDGTWTHQGNHTFNNTLKAALNIDFTAGFVDLRNQDSATSVITRTNVSGDTQPRFAVQADGKMLWGLGGVTATDTNLYRNGVAILKTDGGLRVAQGLIVDGATTIQGSGNQIYGFAMPNSTIDAYGYNFNTTVVIGTHRNLEAQRRFELQADGTMVWGGGSVATDTNLYRSTTNRLKTDGYLHVGGDLILEGAGSDLTMTGGGQVQITGLGATTATALLVQRGVDTQNRYRLLADGKMLWGNGTDDITTQSSNLYRPLTSVLKSDGRFEAVDGLTTKTKAGIPVDGDFLNTPSDGTMVLDTSNERLYVRVGGAWKYSALV